MPDSISTPECGLPGNAGSLPRADYDLYLTRALSNLKLDHTLYAILSLIREATVTQGGHITIVGISHKVGLAYSSITNHTHARRESEADNSKKGKGSPHLFEFDRSTMPFRVFLSKDGREFLDQVDRLVARYASQP